MQNTSAYEDRRSSSKRLHEYSFDHRSILLISQMFSIFLFQISYFTTIQIKLMLCPELINNLCLLLAFIDVLKYLKCDMSTFIYTNKFNQYCWIIIFSQVIRHFCVNQGLRMSIILFSLHFYSIEFCIKILQKHEKNIQRASLDQRLECVAPVNSHPLALGLVGCCKY